MISEGVWDSYAAARCGKMSAAGLGLHALKDAGEGRAGSCRRGVWFERRKPGGPSARTGLDQRRTRDKNAGLFSVWCLARMKKGT